MGAKEQGAASDADDASPSTSSERARDRGQARQRERSEIVIECVAQDRVRS